jgi:nitrite reductase/ring-hydroxylating ferredoxin subunit
MLQIEDENVVRTSLNSHPLCAVAGIPDGGAREVEAEVGGIAESLILTRRAERVAAFLNVCPHAGRRLDWAPGQFLIDRGNLVCAVHGASFDLPTGECIGGPCRGASLRAVPTEVRDGQVWLVTSKEPGSESGSVGRL